MAYGIKLPFCKSNSLNNKTIVYDKPALVYIPLISQNDTNITVLVKKGDYVHKEAIIGRRKGNVKMPIHSSVSGNVIGFEEKYYSNGDLVKCVVIENDFKELLDTEYKNNKKIDDMERSEFVSLLKAKGILGMGGGMFPTYLKYHEDRHLKTLIVNAVECEPLIDADIAIMKEKCEEILEAIDAIVKINNLESAYICIKTNGELKKIINSYLGTYLKIKLIEVRKVYPMGWERQLIKEVLGLKYNNYPSEIGIVVNNVSTIYAIYEALKFNKSLTDRIVTFTGNGIKESFNVLVKNGTLVKDLINNITKYTSQDIKLIAGGPMMGSSIPSDELVVTSNLSGVVVLENDQKNPLLECLRCGKCIEVCPANLSPVLIKDNLKNEDTLKELQAEKCIECGLCSYICPSKIVVREFVKKAKEIAKRRGAK